jgi:hypothetical protein
MTSPGRFVIRARWALAALMLLLAVGAIVLINTSSGFSRQGWNLFVMGVWQIAAVTIPVVIGIDLVGHLIYAGRKSVKGDVRGAARIAAVTVAADALLLACMFAAAVAVLKFVP